MLFKRLKNKQTNEQKCNRNILKLPIRDLFDVPIYQYIKYNFLKI